MAFILPTNEQCVNIVTELQDCGDLTEWEYEFIRSNYKLNGFTDKQKLVLYRICQKYDVKAFPL